MKKMEKKIALTLVLAALFLFSTVSSVGIDRYQMKRHAEKEQLAHAAQLRERTFGEQLAAQEKMLNETRAEIVALREARSVAKLETPPPKTPPSFQIADAAITSSELAPYLSGVVQLRCGNLLGSASLLKLTDEGMPRYAALTNAHVLDPESDSCLLLSGSEGGDRQVAKIAVAERKRWNTIADVAVVPVTVVELSGRGVVPKEELNYGLSELAYCPAQMEVGSPVVAIGFPAFGLQEVDDADGYSTVAAHQIVSDGIISGHTRHMGEGTPLPYSNYFISAKIDSGNSGGIVLSKNAEGVCILGIPTWVSVGNFETQGLVQNIHNVRHKETNL